MEQELIGKNLSGRRFCPTSFKGKISLTPMETVMMIPGELEHLESLVKVARKKKDAEAMGNQISMVSAAPTLR